MAGRESEEQFLLDNTSYYAATAWVNEHISADARVAVDHVFVYPFEPEAIVWSADVLESNAGRGRDARASSAASGSRTRSSSRTTGFAAASWTRSGRALIARVEARPVVSRTLSELGPPELMLVYELR